MVVAHAQPEPACPWQGRVENIYMTFSSCHMKTDGCNCWERPSLTGGKRASLSTYMLNGWPWSYWPSCLPCQNGPCDGWNLPQLPALSRSLVHLGNSLLWVDRICLSNGQVCLVTPFQSLCRGFQIHGHALSMWSYSPTTANRFPDEVIKQVRGGKVIHAVCNQLPLLSSSYLSLCHGLLSGVVSSAISPYPGTHPCHMYNQWSHIVRFYAKTFAFFRAVLFENYPSLEFHSDIVYCQMFRRVENF